MTIAAAIATAIAIWLNLTGIQSPPIVIHEGHLDYASAAIAPREDGGCDLFVSDTWYGYPANWQQLFITHDIGHCLGVWDHPDTGGIMTGQVYPQITALDIYYIKKANGMMRYRTFAVFP